MRLHQVAAYSGQSGCSQECAVLFARLGNEKRFFVMAITRRTQCQRYSNPSDDQVRSRLLGGNHSMEPSGMLN